MPDLFILGKNQVRKQDFDENLASLMQAARKLDVVNHQASAFTEAISKGLLVVLIWLGAYAIWDSSLSVGELITLAVLVNLIHPPIQTLILVNKYIQDGKIAKEKLMELFMFQTQTIRYDKQAKLERFESILLKDVSLYFGVNDPVFEHVNMFIQKGNLTVLKGGNGSGKSTLLYVLMKVFDVSEGKIYIGEVDMAAIKRED